MTDELQTQIESRKTQAGDRNIWKKAVHVALNLGDGHLDRCDGSSSSTHTTTNMVYDGARSHKVPDDRRGIGWLLKIGFHSTAYSSDDTFSKLDISLDGETVFARGHTIESYIPGEWEEELDRLQPLADAAGRHAAVEAKEKKAADERAETADIRKAWGL